MPQTVGAIAYAIAGWLGGSAVAYAVAYTFVYATALTLLNSAIKALSPRPKGGRGYGLETNYAGTAEPRRIVYGTQKLGGMFVAPMFCTGNDGKDLHVILAIAGHEVDDITDVYFDQTVIADADIAAISDSDSSGAVSGSSRYAGKAWIRRYLGTSTQTADYIITTAYPSAFTSDFRGRGVAYLAIRLRYDQKVFDTGIPQLTCMVKGKRVYDPRTTLTVWSNNPALIARDFLVNEVGFSATEIDDATVIAAANICDASVAIPVGSTQPRYQCDITLFANAPWEENLQSIVDTMFGRVVYRDGQWRVYAGAWDTPSTGLTITKNDWVSPTVVKLSVPRNERWNAVRANYVDPDRNWQYMECYPRRNTTYETADGGDRIWREVEFPGVISEYQAQRLAEFTLRLSRNQVRVAGKLRPQFAQLATWDTILVTDDEYGWSSKSFRVMAMELDADGNVDVVLVEDGSATYADLAEGDYSVVTTWPTIDPGATLPSVAGTLYATPQPGYIEFKWDLGDEPLSGQTWRLMESVNSYQGSEAEIWRGLTTQAVIPKADTTTRFYWVQGVVGSYVSLYSPNSWGKPAAANSPPADGTPGTYAPALNLALDGYAFRYSGSGTVIGVNTINVEAKFTGLSGVTATFHARNFRADGTQISSYELSGTGNANRGLHVNSFTQAGSTAYAWVVASGGGYSDRQSVVRLQDGADGSSGTPAQTLALVPTAQQFRYSGSGTNIGVNTIGFYVQLENIAGTAAIYANNYLANGTLINSVALAGPVNSYWLFHINSFTQAGSTAYATIVASVAPGRWDRESIVRLQQGADGSSGTPGEPGASLYNWINPNSDYFQTGPNWVSANSAPAGWSGGPYVNQGFANGAYVTAVLSGGSNKFIGLTNCPTHTDPYQSAPFFWYSRVASSNFSAYENGGPVFNSDSYDIGNARVGVFYDGRKVWYTVDNSVFYSHETSADQVLYMDTAFSGATNNHRYLNVAFGPMGRGAIDGIVGDLTNDNYTLAASYNGYIPSYAGAVGEFQVFDGINRVNVNSITFSTEVKSPSGMTAAITAAGSYSITAGIGVSDEYGAATFRAAYRGVNIDKVFTVSKALGGLPNITGLLTNDTHTVPASYNGFVASPFSLGGWFPLFEGINSVDVNSITYATASNPQNLTHVMSTNGTYRVTGGLDVSEDTGNLTLRGTYKGVSIEKLFTLSKSPAGNPGDPGDPGPPGGIGPPSANILPNGYMTIVDSLTGKLANWDAGAANSWLHYEDTWGIGGSRCMRVSSRNLGVNVWNTEYIPVDPLNEFLDVSVWLRAPSSGTKLYLSMACYTDKYVQINRRQDFLYGWFAVYSTAPAGVNSIAVYKRHGTTQGDLQHTAPANSYNYLTFVPYDWSTDAGSRQYAYREWPGDSFDLENPVLVNTINTTLSQSYDIIGIAGTLANTATRFEAVAHGVDGSTYRYFPDGTVTTVGSTWTKYEWRYGGYHTPYQRFLTTEEMGTFRNGTKHVRFALLVDPAGTEGDLLVDDYIVQRRAYAGTKLTWDPDMRLGGGAWTWNYAQTRINSWGNIVRYSPNSGWGGGGCIRFLPNSTNTYQSTIGGRIKR